MKHVIIGASAAGVRAAEIIHKINPTDEIVMICKEDQIHSRCMLHHYLDGHRTRERLNFTSDQFETRPHFTLLKNTEAISIDRTAREVKVAQGFSVPYDRLLLATGAEAFKPPIEGLSGSNVAVFRDLSDVDHILAILAEKPQAKAVVVGSGLVGLDCISGLAKRGVAVSVVELADNICPLQLDAKSAAAYQTRFEQAGVSFHLGDGVRAGNVDETGLVVSVTLNSGKVLDCDLVVLAVGVRPTVTLAKEAGLSVDRTIVVNDRLQTSDPDIYAAGDITGYAGIWSAAVEQGEVAGMNMVAVDRRYEGCYAFKNTMNFYGLATLSVGIDTEKEGYAGDEIVVRSSTKGYQKYIVRDGLLTFVLSQGMVANMGFLQQLIKRKVPIGQCKKNIFDCSYADFYQYNETTGGFDW